MARRCWRSISMSTPACDEAEAGSAPGEYGKACYIVTYRYSYCMRSMIIIIARPAVAGYAGDVLQHGR